MVAAATDVVPGLTEIPWAMPYYTRPERHSLRMFVLDSVASTGKCM